MKSLPLIVTVLLLAGCAAPNHTVVITGSVIGVQIAQNPASQLYEAKLGYARTEFVDTSTNNVDVLMELRYGSVFNLTSGGIYQRLAIGSNAVTQPGAALMFSKDAKGNFLTNAPVIQQLLLQKPK